MSAATVVPDGGNEKLAAVLEYAQRGWKILPAHVVRKDGSCSCGKRNCDSVGKHPMFENWQARATSDPGVLKFLFGQTHFRAANVAVATGRESGVFVVDEDEEDALDRLVCNHGDGPLPRTLSSVTGSGGSHHFYRHPGVPIPNKVKISFGVDVRGDGGLAVLPPSEHRTGRRYEWDGGIDGPDPIADPPEWLVKLILASGSTDAGSQNGHASRLIGAVIEEGCRNQRLASFAGYLRRLDASFDLILAALQAINAAQCLPPLHDRELRTIARSVSKYQPTIVGGLENMPCNFEGISSAVQIVTPMVTEVVQALKENIPGFALAWSRRKAMKAAGWYPYGLSVASYAVHCGLPIDMVGAIIGQHHREHGHDAEPLTASECIRLLAKAYLKRPPEEKSSKQKKGGRR